MSLIVELKGNFLEIRDSVSRVEGIKYLAADLIPRRDRSDNFTFEKKCGGFLVTEQTNNNRLGVNAPTGISGNQPESIVIYPATDIADPNGLKIGDPGAQWADVDDFDNWLNDNLGKKVIEINGAGFLTYVATDSTLNGDGTFANPLSVVPIPAPSIGFYAQTVRSTTITNTTTESSIVGSGVGSLSVPADTFIVGDSFHAKIGGIISAQNGDGITIRIKTGSIVLASTGLISLEPVTNLGWEIEIDFTITKIGAIGEMSTNGNFAYNRNTGSLEGFVFQDVQNIDTTIANTLDITVEWNQAKTADEIYSSNFVLYKVY